MKARVKETGEIIEVEHTAYDVNGRVIWRYTDIENAFLYTDGQLDFNLEENQKGSQIVPLPFEPDYWEKLKHQYAGMAMQGILANCNHQLWEREANSEGVAKQSYEFAVALVNKLKEGENESK